MLPRQEGGVLSVAIASQPDNQVLTGGVDGTVRIWNPDTGQLKWINRDHEGEVTAVAFARDSRRFVSASSDRTAHLGRGTRRSDRCGECSSGPYGRRALRNFSPDGRWVATGSYDGTADLGHDYRRGTRNPVELPRRYNTDLGYSYWRGTHNLAEPTQ